MAKNKASLDSAVRGDCKTDYNTADAQDNSQNRSVGHSNMCKYTAIVQDFPFRVQIRVEKGEGFEGSWKQGHADGIHRETRRSKRAEESHRKESDNSPCQRGNNNPGDQGKIPHSNGIRPLSRKNPKTPCYAKSKRREELGGLVVFAAKLSQRLCSIAQADMIAVARSEEKRVRRRDRSDPELFATSGYPPLHWSL